MDNKSRTLPAPYGPKCVVSVVKARLWGFVSVARLTPDLSVKCEDSASRYLWKIEIVSTVFGVGETGSGANNTRSAWDPNWEGTYGGVDDPLRRNGFEPAGFRPLQNPFYAALPYFDMQAGRLKLEAPKWCHGLLNGYLGKAEVLLAEDPGTFTRRNRHPRDRIPVRTYKNPKE